MVSLREFPPDEAIPPPIKMGDEDSEAPVVQELKYRSSMLSKNFDDSVTIMARIRLARIALTKLQKAIFGTRPVALESKKIASSRVTRALDAFVWLGMLGCSAENMRLLQRFHRRRIRIMCRVTGHHTRKHLISTEELEQGNMRVRRYSHSQLRVVVLAYSQVTHSVRVMQLQVPVLADFLQVTALPVLARYLQFTCSLLATKKSSSAILS